MPIKDRADYEFYLRADMISSGIERWGCMEWLCHDVMRFQRRLRKAEFVLNCRRGPWGRIHFQILRWSLRRLARRLALEVPLNVLGPGLAIVHPVGIVVSNHSRIGKNCRIHAGVNVGIHRGQAPVIGDNVYLGPGAKIVGGIHIGDGAVVGANAVVAKDVPAGVTVGGVPAKVIAAKDSSEIIPVPGA